MYIADHAEPHFHAKYAEYEAKINLETFEIIKGDLPKRALKLVQEWARLHQEELVENWRNSQKSVTLKNIEPLK